MAIIQAVQKLAARTLAPDKLNASTSRGALVASNQALNLLSQGDKNRVKVMGQGAGSLKQGKNLSNQQQRKVIDAMGAVVEDARQVKLLTPYIVEGAKAWEESQVNRAKAAKQLGKSAQKVAVVTTEAQYAIGLGHEEASLKTRFLQSSYGGAGLSL